MKNLVIDVLKDTTESAKGNLTTFISVGTRDSLGFITTLGTGFIKTATKFKAGTQLRKKAIDVEFEESEQELETADGQMFHPRWVKFIENGADEPATGE